MNDLFQAALPYVWFGLLVLAAAFLFPPPATWLFGVVTVASRLRRAVSNVRIKKARALEGG